MSNKKTDKNSDDENWENFIRYNVDNNDQEDIESPVKRRYGK